MDKLKKYQNIIIELLEEYLSFGQSSVGIQRELIIDKEHNHFQMVVLGWRNYKDYVYIIAFHFDIINEKIWIQQNNTEAKIVDELLERGVLREDIVLGFQHPQTRAISGFAVA